MHKQATEVLKQGGIIAYPTEAVYGLGCDPKNNKALKKLIEIKNRDDAKGFILIAGSFEQIKPCINRLSKNIEKNVLGTWPGFVTWLMPARNSVSNLITVEGRVAVRVSNHPDVIKLCQLFGGPIISTSANISGEPPIKNFAELKTVFEDKVDFFLEGRLGGYDKPSMILDAETGDIVRK